MCSKKSGSKPINFIWKKNGIKINSGDNIIISKTPASSTLLIDPITITSSGNYTCEASNSYGSDGYTAQLLVNGMKFVVKFYFINCKYFSPT